ncbi:hypothetical protein [Luedemannella helvata]|uniref:Uncharacterized protein n=1 Tax=Luedemannella helvata TaxID=349315 RepID=A0ABP4WYW9_9ACTN
MHAELTPVIAATTDWLLAAFPPRAGAWHAALARVQARQAVCVAAWLRYPTALDGELLILTGPGGSGRLDWLVGAEDRDEPWRTWVDEVVASWAACLLADVTLARDAVAALDEGDGLVPDMRRLCDPDAADGRATPLLRHPDLVGAVADLHRAELLARVGRPVAA